MSLHCIHVFRRWFENILLCCICIFRLAFIRKKIKLKLQKKRNYINFCPHLTSFKQNYITARRSVKKRILQRSGEGNQLTENNDNQGETEEVEQHNQNMTKEDYPNLFENLFDQKLALLQFKLFLRGFLSIKYTFLLD